MILILMALAGIQQVDLAVDDDEVRFQKNWCWRTGEQMAGLHRDWKVRVAVMRAVWGVGAVAAVRYVVYMHVIRRGLY